MFDQENGEREGEEGGASTNVRYVSPFPHFHDGVLRFVERTVFFLPLLFGIYIYCRTVLDRFYKYSKISASLPRIYDANVARIPIFSSVPFRFVSNGINGRK